jgi:hypothetical protein
MLGNQPKAANIQIMLEAKNCANTAQASGGWIDVRSYEGQILVTQCVGALTGTVVGSFEDSDAANGANNLAFLPDEGNNFASVSSANNIQKKTIDARKPRGWLKYIGTIGTGPAVVSVTLAAHPKYV